MARKSNDWLWLIDCLSTRLSHRLSVWLTATLLCGSWRTIGGFLSIPSVVRRTLSSRRCGSPETPLPLIARHIGIAVVGVLNWGRRFCAAGSFVWLDEGVCCEELVIIAAVTWPLKSRVPRGRRNEHRCAVDHVETPPHSFCRSKPDTFVNVDLSAALCSVVRDA